jgi:hypothetical protein
VPISLGGHPSDPRNIWPQSRYGQWTSKEKDRLEHWAHSAVCNGKVNLVEIQNMFMNDWISGYRKYIKPQ